MTHPSLLPRPARVFTALALAFAALLPLHAADAQQPARKAATEERWYVVEMMGKRAGWMRSRSVTEPDGAIRTEGITEIKISRGAVVVPISISSVFIETADGEPVSMVSSQKLGAMPVSTRYEFKGDEVVINVDQGGRTTTSTVAAPTTPWTTPGTTRRFVQAQLEAGAKEFSVTTIDAMAGLTPITARYVIEGPAVVEAMGKMIPAVKWRVEQSYMPGAASVEYVDLRGEPVKMEMNLGAGLSMTLLASEREVALSKLEPAEIMASTFVRPSRPIDQPRAASRASYVLSIPVGPLPDLPASGAQRVERLGEQSVRVAVDTTSIAEAPADETSDSAFTGRSAMIDPTDPEIIALTQKATASLPPDAPAAQRAEALRRFVYEYVDSKNLGIGLATASEVCRTREGDCSEHAVLLAAMLRAQGVPSRVASGLIYADRFLGADDIFGYHMWTQALLDVDGSPRWVDLDATLPPETPTDATHIALSYSSMAEGDMINSLAALAPLIGQLQIRVESAE